MVYIRVKLKRKETHLSAAPHRGSPSHYRVHKRPAGSSHSTIFDEGDNMKKRCPLLIKTFSESTMVNKGGVGFKTETYGVSHEGEYKSAPYMEHDRIRSPSHTRRKCEGRLSLRGNT